MTISHDLGKDAAIERIRGGFDQIGSVLGPIARFDQSWAGDSLNFTAKSMGQTITGKLDVRDKEVLIELVLPGLLGSMADRIAGKLKKQSTLLLEKK